MSGRTSEDNFDVPLLELCHPRAALEASTPTEKLDLSRGMRYPRHKLPRRFAARNDQVLWAVPKPSTGSGGALRFRLAPDDMGLGRIGLRLFAIRGARRIAVGGLPIALGF